MASWVVYQHDDVLETETRFDPPEGGGLLEEPTEIASLGLNPQCGIRARLTQERYIYLIDPAETGQRRVCREFYRPGNPSGPEGRRGQECVTA